MTNQRAIKTLLDHSDSKGFAKSVEAVALSTKTSTSSPLAIPDQGVNTTTLLDVERPDQRDGLRLLTPSINTETFDPTREIRFA